MYKLTSNTSIIRLFDNAWIPADPRNIDYAAYQAWLAGGGVPTPVDVKPLAETQADAWEKIKAERERRTENGGYLASGNWFQSDTFSRTQQLGLARQADLIAAASGDMSAAFKCPDGTDLLWKTMGGSWALVTPTLTQAVALAVYNHDIATFKACESHKAAMMLLPDPTTYDFTAGWPIIYGE